MRNPEIYGGSGICVVYPLITKEKLCQCLAKTKGSERPSDEKWRGM